MVQNRAMATMADW